MFDIALNNARSRNRKPGWADRIALSFVYWFGLYHLLANLLYFNRTPERWLLWVLLPAAIVSAVVITFVIGRWGRYVGRHALLASLIVLLAVSLTTNGLRIRRLHYLDNNFNMAETNRFKIAE